MCVSFVQAAKRELERQRQLEWERQRRQELPDSEEPRAGEYRAAQSQEEDPGVRTGGSGNETPWPTTSYIIKHATGVENI